MKLLLIATLVVAASAVSDIETKKFTTIYGISPTEVLDETGKTGLTPVITQRFLGIKDILEYPIMVFAQRHENPEYLMSYFCPKGLRSVKTEFKPLFEYFKTTPDLVGLIFYPKGIYNAKFFETVIYRHIWPENFKVSEFLKTVDEIEEYPILLVLPREQFEKYHFNGLTEVARFGVYDDIIEPVPVGTHQIIKTELPFH